MNTSNIRREGDWFLDDNGNKCSIKYFGTEERAEKALRSLKNCKNCTNCSGCSGCSGCSDCSDCSRCSGCSGLKNARPVEASSAVEATPAFVVPKIENIHQKVYAAASAENALDMSTWHVCETTHCRAGWVIHLAGEAGYNLQKQTSHEFAAMQIYKASSNIHVSPNRFFYDNEKSLADMKLCAEMEAADKEKA